MTTFLLLITAHVIARLLLSEIYQPLEITYINLLVQILLDLIAAIFHSKTDRWWTWTCISWDPITTHEMTTQVTKFVFKNKRKSE